MERAGWQGRLVSVTLGLFSAGAVAWCLFVDLETGPWEFCRVLAGLAALWLPVGSVVYLALGDRCADGLTRCTLSAAASYGLTTPLYVLCGAIGLAVPGFQYVFYVLQGLMVAAALGLLLRRGRLGFSLDVASALRRVDWLLAALVGLSLLTTSRYKQTIVPLPGQDAVRLAQHGDTTYLTAQAYELGRRTPALQQSIRVRIKERAYHMFPHATAMLIARYAGQADMLRAVLHYQYTVVDVLLVLIGFCTVRRLTESRGAGYLAAALLFVLAIPMAPMTEEAIGYFYFTLLPYSSSSLEPSILCSPHTYCALPPILAALLATLEFGAPIAAGCGAAGPAIVAGLLAAVSLRFRVQAFLILFPGMMLLLAWLGWRTRQRAFWLAATVAVLAVGVQLLEMRSPAYYPASAGLEITDNHLALDCQFLAGWPGASAVRGWLEQHLTRTLFRRTWQIVCLSSFAVLNIAGLPMVLAALLQCGQRRSWQTATGAYTAMIVWMAVGTAIGSTCLRTHYDHYSLGGESLFLYGWYLMPMAAAGLWTFGRLMARAGVSFASCHAASVCRAGAVGAAVVVVLAATVWQRVRPESRVEMCVPSTAAVLSREEWNALTYMRENLPADAVLATNTRHHPPNYCVLSGIAGRTTYLEYMGMGGPLGGSATDQWPCRQTRLDRLWDTDNPDEFAAYILEIGATHLVEYAERPLHLHPSNSLEEFWIGPQGKVKVWTLRTIPGSREIYREVRRRSDPDGEQFRVY